MIKLLIKKTFFDAWDNLLSLILINLIFLILIFAAVSPFFFFKPTSVFTIIMIAFPGFLLLNLYAGIISYLLYDVSDFGSIKLSGIGNGFKKTWKASATISAINTLIFTVISIAMTFYMSMDSILNIAGAGITFWIGLTWLLSCQFFYPILIQMNGNIIVTIKKSLLITLDNPFFSIFVFIHSVVVILLSIFTVLLMPGAAAVLLLHQNALKLRLYKYDWLEKNEELNNKKIPWTELLTEIDKRIGHRSLKGMIFPWKD